MVFSPAMAKTLAMSKTERAIEQLREHILVLESNQEALLTALSETNLRVLYLLKQVRVKKAKPISPLEIEQAQQFEEGTLSEFYAKDRTQFLAQLEKERAAHDAPPPGAQSPQGRVVAIDSGQIHRRTH